MKHECPKKEMDEKKKDVKGKKVIKAFIESDDEENELEEVLSKFCCIEI